jgi:hypothetical protein
MGFTPAQVDGCSLWEFLVCREGWIAANCPEETAAPTPEQHDAMIEKWG